MAYIILPSRRTRQPQGAVRVDWSNPLTRGLTNLLGMYGGTMRQFALDATVPALYGSLPQYLLADGSVGLYNSESVASGTVNNYIELPVITSSAISVLVHGARFATPVGGQVAVIAATRAGGEVSGWEMAAGNSYGNSNLFYFTPLNVGSNPAFFSNGRKNSGNNPSDTSVENGKTYTVLGSFSAHTIGSGHSILAKASGAADYCEPNAVSLYATWSRQLSDNESVDLTRNPWQLFAPDPRRLWFAPSGGGATIFESTFADSWSLSDTYSASANLVSTYADSPTVIDSSSSSAVFSSAFDETIPVSDGPSADMGGTANRTQEESFTITDAYSASMVANATISETFSAEASASAAAIFNATFAETLPIVDGEEADAGRISDIAENVTVTDAYTAGIIAQATQAESVTTIDTYDTIAIYNPTLEETLPITDVVGATLTVPTSGTVDLSQESIDALAYEIMVQLTSTPVRKL